MRTRFAVVVALLLVAGACGENGTKTDAGTGSPVPASRPSGESATEALVEEAVAAAPGDLRVLASLRTDGALFAVIEKSADPDARWQAVALAIEGDQVEVVDVAAETGPGQPVFPELPARGSGATDLVPLDAAGATVSAGFVDPKVTRIDVVEDGEVVDTSAPASTGATIFRVEPWAQIRMYHEQRLAGATLAAGLLSPVSGRVGRSALEATDAFMAAVQAGEAATRFFASGVPPHVAKDLLEAFREAGIDTSGRSSALGGGAVTITFPAADVPTDIALYVMRESGRWKIYQYSLGAGFGTG